MKIATFAKPEKVYRIKIYEMRWIDTVDEIHDKYFRKCLKELNFKEYQSMDGNGMGALKKYKNDVLKIQLLNDRGIVTFEVSSILGEEDFIEFEFIMRYFERQAINGQELSKLEQMKLMGKRYSFDEQAQCFLKNWSKLTELFTQRSHKRSIREIFDK